MKIGTLEILKAYLGSLELTNNNAFVGDVALISGGQPVPPVTIQPLTFTALEAGSTVKFNRSGVTSSYSIDGGTTWTSGDNVTVTLANVGDKVMYKATTGTISSSSTASFTLSGQLKASGSIMSMYDEDPEDTLLDKSYMFSYYFYNQTALKDISELIIKLDTSTTYNSLTRPCYYMFRGCTGISGTAKVEVSHVGGSGFLDQMFYGCSSLNRAEITGLDGGNMILNSYSQGMSSMFRNCTVLNYIKCMAQYTGGTNNISMSSFTSSVASTGTFVKATGQNWTTGTSGIPTNWIVEEPEPPLPDIKGYVTLRNIGNTDTTVTVTNPDVSINVPYYSTDTTNWARLKTSIVVTPGSNIYLCGKGQPTNETYNGNQLSITGGSIKVFGNARFLYECDNETAGTTPTYALCNKFKNCTAITDISELVLPTSKDWSYYGMFEGCTGLTTLSSNLIPPSIIYQYSCARMFYGCTGLTTIPQGFLTSSNIYKGGYSNMFNGCSGLTSIPSDLLPAKYLYWVNCYEYMFANCTGLTSLPSGLLSSVLAVSNYVFYHMFEGCTGITTIPQGFLPTQKASHIYSAMFKNCTSLVSVPSDLISGNLSTTYDGCCANMFYGCTSLTAAPTLPSTTLASTCYNSMFYGCRSLTTLPTLPATTLQSSCYSNMFDGCTGITTIPQGFLPATTLASRCYSNMFNGCSGLTSIPSDLLPATTLADSCYSNMFDGCTGITTIPQGFLPATTLQSSCYSYMFEGCSSLVEAPVLPATSLVSSCYTEMFRNCTSLNKVTTYFTSWTSSNTRKWLEYVSSTGDFYNLGGATISSGTSGIPTNWTVHTSL